MQKKLFENKQTVITNFHRKQHVWRKPIGKPADQFFVGWENSGNHLAAVVVSVPSRHQLWILAEYVSDSSNLRRFTCQILDRIRDEHGIVKEIHDQSLNITHYGNVKGIEQLRKHLYALPVQENIGRRIQAVTQRLSRPDGILIDPRCKMLIEALQGAFAWKNGPPRLLSLGREEDTVDNEYKTVFNALSYVVVKIFAPITTRTMETRDVRQIEDRYDILRFGLDRGFSIIQ